LTKGLTGNKFIVMVKKIIKDPAYYLSLLGAPRLMYRKLVRKKEIPDLPAVLKSGPIQFFVEVSSRCSLNCIMCDRKAVMRTDTRSGIMSQEIFKFVLPELRYAQRINFFGSGEPFQNPYLSEFIKQNRNNRIHKSIFTNGLSEKIPEIAPDLFNAGIHEISFSLDACTPETYGKIRIGGDFNTAWENLSRLESLRNNFDFENGLPRTQININFILMKTNFRELPALVRKVADLNIDYLRIIHLAMFDSSMEEESVQPFEQKVNKIIEEVLSIGKERGINISLPLNHNFNDDNKLHKTEYFELDKIPYENFCLEPWRTLMVYSDGSVPICCYNPTILGNISNTTIMKIWNSKKMQKIRRLLKSGNRPVFCEHCPRFSVTSEPYYKHMIKVK